MKQHSSMKNFSNGVLNQSSVIGDSKVKMLLESIKSSNFNALQKEDEKHLSENIELVIEDIKRQEKPKLRKIEQDLINIRCRVFDWIIVVINKLKYHNSTYFLTTDILDKLIEKFDYDVEDVHMLAIASLMIACKFDEVEPIEYRQATSYIGHDIVNEKILKEQEMFLLGILSFKMPKNHFVEFSSLIVKLLIRNGIKPKKIESEGILPSYQLQKYNNSNPEKKLIRITLNDVNSNVSLESNKFKIDKIVIKNEIKTMMQEDTEYERIVLYFSISAYKLVRTEYELYRNNDSLVLYFSILYFSFNFVNKFLNLKGKSNFTSFFDLAEQHNVKIRKVLDLYDVITQLFNSSPRNNNLRYIRELELSRFIK